MEEVVDEYFEGDGCGDEQCIVYEYIDGIVVVWIVLYLGGEVDVVEQVEYVD